MRCQYLQHGDTACTCQLLLLLNSNSLRFRPAIETLVSIYQISFNLSRLLITDSSTLSISHSHLVTSRQAQCILALERFLRSPLGADIFFRFSKIECWWEVGHVSSSGCMIIWWSAAAVCVGKLEVCHYCVGGEMDGWHDVEDMVLLWCN